jgi:hypothetical protein
MIELEVVRHVQDDEVVAQPHVVVDTIQDSLNALGLTTLPWFQEIGITVVAKYLWVQVKD